MKEDILDDDKKAIEDSLYQFIILLVSKYIVNAARLLVKGKLTRISMSTGQSIVKYATKNILKEPLREAVKEVLMEWMKSPNDDFIEYLFNMRQNFLCLEVLNLDPECKRLQREAFSEKRMFLDTNVLMGLTLPAVFSHEQTKKFIANTLRLGCTLYVSERTIDEFNYVLDKGKMLNEKIKATPEQKLGMGNVFIRSHQLVQLSGTILSWEDYVDQFSDMPDFLRQIGIQVYETEHKEIEELDRYDDTVRAIQRCFQIFRNREKTTYVAEHDAYHLLLMKTLRETETPIFLGPNTWFLTLDLTLSCVDRFINRNFTFPDSTSPSMVGYLWDEIISPFLVGIVQEKELLDIFRTFVVSDFTPISEEINADSLVKLAIDWTEFDWLDIEEIRETYSNNNLS